MAGENLYREYIYSIWMPQVAAVTTSAKDSFIGLFHSVNGTKDFDLAHELNNPWVWAVRFEVISTQGNPEPDVYKIQAAKLKN